MVSTFFFHNGPLDFYIYELLGRVPHCENPHIYTEIGTGSTRRGEFLPGRTRGEYGIELTPFLTKF